MQVVITFHSEKLSAQLRQLADKLQRGEGRHIRQGLVDGARAYMAYIRGRFFRASRHDGTWKDHAVSTKIKKAAKFAPGVLRQRASASAATGTGNRLADAVSGLSFPILYETGALFRSLTPGNPGYTERFAGPTTIFVGTAVPYGIYHQTGTSRMPQRTVLDFPDARTKQVMDGIIAAAVDREVAETNAAMATA